ncbi:acetyl-CoA carboxylase biotin carboxyl carrier protein subunit [Robertkochia marina]|uniref:Acetyl-CoA carboxylase biotin carboxyl carrier protein subunit n=1 Tax=Robertkochia marina TaxID=1227945 RepID=A0A4S3LZ34_9FLAO|nr:acetyl-CoA carboxylase biotin carboxyl carrier protein subunit [Robertkochia marina]THD67370.1 acetyl-CoA carboxylase biotin carboxyl carrier protein subunit [Robertkochia marina]TRZ43025.1 acetyl-CoA carboxylase biotin carboxyl carrier protein subunit [Robertkochia marina]
MPERYRARVNDKHEFSLSEDDLKGLDIVKTDDDTYHIIYNNQSVFLRVIKSDSSSGVYQMEMDGALFDITLEKPLDLFIKEMGFSVGKGALVDRVTAPMPGLLLDVYVEEGQEVEKDEPLLVLEAMKMENVILSPRKGVISGIMQEKGQTVDKGTELISFE